jgi:CRISPR-associated protein Cmx8
MPSREIELTFDPFILPTAQHRAGLAGLLVTIESMRCRRIKPLPEILRGDDGKVSIRLTKESLQTLFDDLYDAFWEERKSKEKPKGTKIRNIRRVDTDEVNAGTGKREKAYKFEAVAAKGAFLKALGIPDPWLKLWRESIWATLRGVPKTRIPYKERVEGKHVGEADVVWKELQQFEKARTQNRFNTVNIVSSIFIGAHAENAERVPFQGRADEVFLLHFWPVVMGVYVPEVIDRDGKTKFVGYVFAVPDVSDLRGFILEFPHTLAQFGNAMAGYRPRGAVISLPQEGGLEYLHNLLVLAKGKAQAGELAYNVAGVEVYHLEKRGNSIHVLAADRVAATHHLLEEYEAIRGRYRDPLFRRQIILNLLRGEPWYGGFDRVFSKNDRKRFIGSQAERFSTDIRRRFEIGFQERRSA